MARGRDTELFRIDRRVRNEIIENCSQPELMKQIFDLTMDLARRRITTAAFDLFCKEQPCIFWRPDDEGKRHVQVRIALTVQPVMAHVARVVWAITHVISEQGQPLRGYEELLHSCGNNGKMNTGFETCLNPAHLLRGDANKRAALAKARRTLRSVGIEQVSA